MVGKPWDGRRKALTQAQIAQRYRDKKKHGAKLTRRAEREAAVIDRTQAASAALGGMDLYPVLYADPPWAWEAYSAVTGQDRGVTQHYPTMTSEAICALRVPAAPDAVLFLWATAPRLPDALQVMAAWGFAYKSHLIWRKDRIGLGYWARSRHELLLIGTRGKMPAPLPGTQSESIIDAPYQGEHSRKPAAFAELIERLYPTLPHLELFARPPFREGWGNSAAPAAQDQAA